MITTNADTSALTTNYTYNVRSWIKTLTTSTLFNQTLYYNESYGGNTPCYNGNISAMSWKASGDTGLHGYRFSYDRLSRLTSADYLWNGISSTNYSTSYTYNKQSNITSLRRNGRTGASSYGLIDNLTFTLDGNKLTRTDDAATASAYNGGFEFKDAVKQADEYAYDKNGNMTKDLNKNITDIQYNCLNLPSKVTFKDGSTITYTYALNGTKLRTVHKIGNTTTTTDYCGNVVYENGVQKLLLTDAGYITFSDKKYHYYLQDHQGNNRVVVDQTGQKEEVNHYYPFGGTFASADGNVQAYKYNGKELDTKKGVNWYDYGARQYDPALGRFTTVDRFAEKYYPISPYQYGGNHPINNIDVNGDSIVVLNHGEGMHMAMLIQNNDNKWQYFSVNGDNVYISGKFFGGRKSDDIAVGEFNSPQDFFESSYNSAGNGNEDANSINGYGFSEGYIIPTTAKQDNMMRTTFENISQNEEYDLLGNNCSTTVQRSMEAAGIKTYDMNLRSYKVPANRNIGESSFVVTHADARPIIPQSSFKSIIKHNPQGNMIYRIKKR